MAKMNTELFNLLSEPKTFDITIELIEQFDNFRNQLFNSFWNKLMVYLNQSDELSSWKINSSEGDIMHSEISFFQEENDPVYFYLYYRQNKFGTSAEFVYGIGCMKESLANVNEIYDEAKIFKKDGWKIGNLNTGSMPIWYTCESINFSINKNLKEILPINVDSYAKETADMIISDFTDEIKDFIIKHCKK